jgi:site-specific recombinase XerD
MIGFMNNVRLTSARQTFMLDCRAAGVNPAILHAYRDVLAAFIKYTGDITVQELKPGHVRAYITDLLDHSRPMRKHYVVIRMWIRWLYAQRVITERLPQPTKPPRLAKSFPTRRSFVL